MRDERELTLVETGSGGAGVAPQSLVELGMTVVEGVEQSIDFWEARPECPVMRRGQILLVVIVCRVRATVSERTCRNCADASGEQKRLRERRQVTLHSPRRHG